MTTRSIRRVLACTAAAMLCAVSVPASTAAADDEAAPMTFRISAETTYFTEEELAKAKKVVPAALYIDNYSGICSMKTRIKSEGKITVINGDFTRDPDQTEIDEGKVVNKPAFFETHGTATYTRYSSDTGKLMNIALWYSPDSFPPTPGVVANPESSFLSFDINIPKATAAGVYRVYVSKDFDEALYSYDTFVYDANNQQLDVPVQDCRIVVEPGALRGDVDCDGEITARDPQCALRYYANVTVSESEPTNEDLERILTTPYIHTSMEAANVDANTKIDLIDSMAILRYYAYRMSDMEVSWDECINR